MRDDGLASQAGCTSAVGEEVVDHSREQSSGIDQVSKAVGSMDQITQQNAALVEVWRDNLDENSASIWMSSGSRSNIMIAQSPGRCKSF